MNCHNLIVKAYFFLTKTTAKIARNSVKTTLLSNKTFCHETFLNRDILSQYKNI